MSIFDKVFRRGDQEGPEHSGEDAKQASADPKSATTEETTATFDGSSGSSDDSDDDRTEVGDGDLREDTIPGRYLTEELTPTPPMDEPTATRAQTSDPTSPGEHADAWVHSADTVNKRVTGPPKPPPGRKVRPPVGPNKPNQRVRPDTSEISSVLAEFDDAATNNTHGKGALAIPEAGTAQNAGDRESLRSLVEELAGHHMGPVRDLLLEIQNGSARTEWIDLALPAAKSVREMSKQIELKDLTETLEELVKSLQSARGAGAIISGEARESILSVHGRLRALLPGALELDEEKRRREPVIVRALLRQVPGIQKLEIDKLAAAGLLSLDTLAKAPAEQIHDVTGIEQATCARLAEVVRTYSQGGGSVASVDTQAEHQHLGKLLETLKHHNRDFDDAAKQWTQEAKAKKRDARKGRSATLLRIHVSLARLGRLESLSELDRLPFRRKVQFIDRYLSTAKGVDANGH